MSVFRAIFLRELRDLLETPIALIVAVAFLIVSGLTTFYLGRFFENELAQLDVFFAFHPWIYLFFVPAIGMRLWAEERQQGTIELLLTWPVPLTSAILGKFFAAWAFIGAILALTFPMWLTVNYLGAPDNGVILASYIASFFLAGSYLAICLTCSIVTRNQVIAFILGSSLCAFFVVIGWHVLLDLFAHFLSPIYLDILASLSFLTHFDSILRGVISLANLTFFLVHISVWLITSVLLLHWLTKTGQDMFLDKQHEA